MEGNRQSANRATSTRRIQRARIKNRDAIAIYLRCEGLCGICGTKVDLDVLQFDHIIPLRLGGCEVPENLQIAHKVCNDAKEYSSRGRKPRPTTPTEGDE